MKGGGGGGGGASQLYLFDRLFNLFQVDAVQKTEKKRLFPKLLRRKKDT